jgi:hypothetical protein
MFRWFWRQLLRRRCVTPRSLEELGSGLEALARSGTGGWLLAQERARLEFIAARERFTQHGSDAALQDMLVRLYHLESTNAVVQSLIQERRLEEMLLEEETHASGHLEAGSPGRHGAGSAGNRGTAAALS